MRRRRRVRLEDLVGRRVRAADGSSIGRIEEVRAERRADGEHEVTEFLIGAGALVERWSLSSRLFGWRRTIVARWDQIDISRPDAPVLTCAPGELKVEAP